MKSWRKFLHTRNMTVSGDQTISTSYPVSNLFDGNISTYVRGDSNTNTAKIILTFTYKWPRDPLPEWETFSVYLTGNRCTVYVNSDNEYGFTVNPNTWTDIKQAGGGGNFTGRIDSICIEGLDSLPPRLNQIRGTNHASDGGATYTLQDNQELQLGHQLHTITTLDASNTTLEDSSIEYQPTTNTPFVTPTFESQQNAISNVADTTNYTLDGLTESTRWPLQGRRPAHGLKYPRGYYNK